jgi:hypothetical protein
MNDEPETEGAVNENEQTNWLEFDPFAGKSVALGEIGREGE